MDLSKYAVLVPFQDHIRHPTESCLDGVEKIGVPVVRQPGCSEISFCRSQMASDALEQGKEAILFVDSDIEFDPYDALYVLRRPEPIIGGLYTQKYWGADGRIKLNATFTRDVTEIDAGKWGHDYPATEVAAGFLRIRADVLRAMIDRLEMPCCTRQGGKVWPFFLPMVAQEDNGEWGYVGEDYAFCRRARSCGFSIVVDTRIRLSHRGTYPFDWEDATRPIPTKGAGITMRHGTAGAQ
jgi:hypothetical protein